MMETKIVKPNFDVKFEVKQDNDEMIFSGYGAVFDNIDSYDEKIIKGAFKKSISAFKKGSKFVAMLKQHGFDTRDPIGVWQSMSEDDYGLKVTGKISGTQDGKDIYTLLSDGAISGLSIGYIPTKVTIDKVGKKEILVLEEIDLHEISIVTFPANTLARISDVKSEVEKKRFLENILRDAGLFSKKEAKTIVSKCEEIWRRDDVDNSSELVDVFKLFTQHTNFIKGFSYE